MVIDWNANRMNLTRLVSPEQIALNHFLDSLIVTSFLKIPKEAQVIDIGTGAGFPGLALKIFRPDIKLALVESTAKKLTFCKAVAEELALVNIDFIHGRAEEAQVIRQLGGRGTVVTARAVAQLPILLRWADPLLSRDGVFVAWKGARVHEETAEARDVAHQLGIKMKIEEQTISVPGVEPLTHYYVVCRRKR
jgi:16S rRNA (guanine527-N7)-methyltransferase